MPPKKSTAAGLRLTRSTPDTPSTPPPKQAGMSPARPLTPAVTVAASPHPEPRSVEDSELAEMLASLPEENKTLVKILQHVIAQEFKNEIKILKEEIDSKNTVISTLSNEVAQIKNKVQDLESHIDRVEQYERRDTLIVSGPDLPAETPSENPTTVVVSTIKDQLNITLKEEDISVAHRLGPVNQQRSRPIIFKLVNRSVKYDLVGSCVRSRPKIYLNESLTPPRLTIFRQLLAIRKQHRPKFQQLFTKDGNITIKLRHSETKHTVTDHTSLMTLLNMYPYMKESYEELFSV